MLRSLCACKATSLVWFTVPVSEMLPMPVIEVPGETPISPVMVVGPVFVTAWAPSTAKLAAVPRLSAHAGTAKNNSAERTKIDGADLKNFMSGLLGESDSPIGDVRRGGKKMLSNCGQRAKLFIAANRRGKRRT